jgi:hypothetical protein
MPIRPENKARYPKDWKTVVVPRIRARSGNRCECTGQCGQTHMWDAANPGRCSEINGAFIGEGDAKIVLTVMHLNHQPEDCRDENLLHACQGCHNRYDAPVRAAGIKARRKAQRAISDLFKPTFTLVAPDAFEVKIKCEEAS